MDRTEALTFLRHYFDELFIHRNLAALDENLSPDYFDDDIGESVKDHIANSKDYLTDWFAREPTVRVEVVDAICHDDVITGYLNWYRVNNKKRESIYKGVACFVMKDKRIVKRHTFLYWKEA